MLSPHTPPGTRVVCIDDESLGRYNVRRSAYGLDGLTKGETYTVKRIEAFHLTTSGFLVVLAEVTRPRGRIAGFALERFRRVDLPECLTSLLNVAPTDSGADKSITAEG